MNDRVEEIFKEVGALITDSHVVLTSGKHSCTYMNKDAVYAHPQLTAELCHKIAMRFMQIPIDAVIAPAIGGVIISQWTAYHLSKIQGHEVLSLYAEKTKDGEDFVIKRGYDKLIDGKNILVGEDVVTTGGSANKVVKATQALGGNVVAVAVLCNRGNVTEEDVGSPKRLFSLLDIDPQTWPEEDCQLCKAGVPVNTSVGKGQEFLDALRC